MYTSVEKVKKLCHETMAMELEVEEDFVFFIEKAQARVDAFLAKRYGIPLVEPVPLIIESITTDFAASFTLDKYFAQRMTKEQTVLSEVYFKRAQADLLHVIDDGLLDNAVGIVVKCDGNKLQKAVMRSTTRKKVIWKGH